MRASSGWPPGPARGHEAARSTSTSRVLRTAWTPSEPEFDEVGAHGVARLLGDEEGQDRRARGVVRLLAQVEERVERRVPAAPRDERGLPRRRDRPAPARGARRPRDRPRAFAASRRRPGGPDLLRVHEVAAEGGDRGRPLAGRPEQAPADRLQADRQEPGEHGDDRAREDERWGRGGVLCASGVDSFAHAKVLICGPKAGRSRWIASPTDVSGNCSLQRSSFAQERRENHRV